ncbi:Holliday junction branch migration protein RuvA [Pseudooceanicola sp. MF1-13]|uniref:Holliday junction branch migration protein RuvA n=1 Tax=Pseudooceanicola sp. MF1-13 TaxID=3379095 RepID=UPI0038929469
MIGRIAGRIDMRGPDYVLIDVRGVGYMVYVSDRTLMAMPGPGEAAALYTELIVREDLLQLYGFPTLVEKEWFRLLTSVQGVGAKGALAILGALGADGLSRAIALGDQASVKAAKGIGPKTAQRIVLELKDKAPAVMAMGTSAPTKADDSDIEVIEPATAAPKPKPASAAPANANAQAEALSALSNLGYAPSEAAAAVAEAAGETPDAETPALIRSALKKLAPKG